MADNPDINELMLDRLSDLYDVKPEDLEIEELPLYAGLQKQGKRYSEEELIARGGMKDVLKVFDEKTGRYIALARLHEEAPEELFEPFLREARLTALLDHPNIISIFDIGLDDMKSPYFTMELKTGKDLSVLLQEFHQIHNGPFAHGEMNSLLDVFIKICDAIAYAHAQNILHLDLKPENIQVGKYGEVIVCDWGLGKVQGQEEQNMDFDQLLLNPDLLNNMTLLGEIKGTPGFMAPEQVHKGGEKTAQTDIYALGSILCLILSGKTAIEGDTETVLDRTLTGDFEIDLPTGAPGSLRAVILKALALAPEDRYESVNALSHDVRSYLSGYATEAENAGIFKQFNLLYKRNKVLCCLCAAFILLATTGTLGFIHSLNNSRVLAEKSRILAEEQKQQAEENLQLYLAGQKQIDRLSQNHAKELRKDSRIYSHKMFFKDPVGFHEVALAKINKAIKLAPDQLELYSSKGSLLFLKQNFTGALKAFEMSAEKNEDLYLFCKNLVKKGESSKKLLSVDQFVDIIMKSQKFRVNYFEDMIVYDQKVRKDKTGYEKVIKALVRLANQRRNFEFKYDLDQGVFLSGIDLRRLNSPNSWGDKECLLRFLDFEYLNIRHSGITNLQGLKGLTNLKELDIRNTAIQNLSPLNKISSLQKLTFHAKQFSKEQLAVLNPRVQLEIK